ncbi:SDH family Clp fold serine proteinase [Methanocaldococcus indicus]|uniref:SDH family Clp fold serine proteinase n=1 Tax=Methanocaldococcus indicus TaxID=213231 RepID=UPI003C6CF039
MASFDFFFFIFFFFLFLYPEMMMRYRIMKRLRCIKELEKERKSRVIAMIHRQEVLSLFGIPIYRYITIEDSEEVLRAIRLTPDDMPIDLIIHTPGGIALAAEQIALALKEHKAETRVIVPHYAMSGGTLIALAADKIIMDKNAVLGPVDPQLGQYPAASILETYYKKGEKLSDETLILVDIAKKAISQMEDFVYNLLKDKFDDKKAKKLARILTEGRWTHDYPLTVKKLRELGIDIDTNVPKKVYKLLELYPQPKTNRPSVYYIPVPYNNKRDTYENKN